MKSRTSWISELFPTPVLWELYRIQFEPFIRKRSSSDSQSSGIDLKEISLQIEKILTRPEECGRWFNTLPGTVKETIKIILVEGQQKVPDLEKEVGVNLIRRVKATKANSAYVIMPGFYLFQLTAGLNPTLENPKENYAIDLPHPIKNLLRKSILDPMAGTILDSTRPVEEVDEWNSEVKGHLIEILTILKGQSGKVRSRLIKNLIQKQDEPYPPVNPEQIDRAIHLLTRLFDLIREEIDDTTSPLDLIKSLLNVLKKGELDRNSFIPWIYGTGKADIDLKNNVDYFVEFINLLTLLPESRWVESTGLIRYFLRSNDLFFNENSKTYTYSQNKDKIWIDSVNRKDLVEKPLLKNLVCFLGLIGILAFSKKNEITLSALGLEVLKAKTSLRKPLLWKEEVRIDLDSDHLLIELSAEDPVAQNFIETFAIKRSKLSYSADIITLISKVKTGEDLDRWEELFKAKISDRPPEVWKAFLKNARERIDPLELRDDMVIYQLSEEQKELAKLLTSDLELQKILFRVEDYKIALLKKDLPNLKSRLKQKGYLL